MNNEVQTIDTQEGQDEYKTIIDPNFTAIMYEAEKYMQQGWSLSKIQYPYFSYIMYEVHLERNARTIAAAKERLNNAVEGRPVWDTDKRREQMAKARAAKKNAKEQSDADQV